MRRIIGVHFPEIHDDLVENAIAAFYHMRELEAVEKRPATRELINWIRALCSDPDFTSGERLEKELPYLGVLFKKSQDYERANGAVSRRRRF